MAGQISQKDIPKPAPVDKRTDPLFINDPTMERVVALFTNDRIDYLDWEDDQRKPWCAEQRLWAAVLEDAVKIYREGGGESLHRKGQRGEYERVVKWFASKASDLPSFIGVCDVLGIDAAYFLAQLKFRGEREK